MTMNNLDFTYGCKNTRKFVFFQILGLVDMVSKKHVAPKKPRHNSAYVLVEIDEVNERFMRLVLKL